MLTVSRLARACGLSRTAVLYYETIGLLRQPPRTSGGYRRYSEADLSRLRQVRAWRDAGLTLADIRALVEGPTSGAARVLERRLEEIESGIERLREQRGAILLLLKNKASLRRNKVLTKDKFVSILRAAGLTEEEMARFHREFEKNAPEDHQEFLEFLKIGAEEIGQIRAWSRGEAVEKK
jgi:MerR family transcriptional regulator, thiopeptide resistance regulator